MRTLDEMALAQQECGTTYISTSEREALKRVVRSGSPEDVKTIRDNWPLLYEAAMKEQIEEEHDRYIVDLRADLRQEVDASIKSSRAALMKVRKLASNEVYDVEFVDSPVATLLERAELDLYSALAIIDRIIK